MGQRDSLCVSYSSARTTENGQRASIACIDFEGDIGKIFGYAVGEDRDFRFYD